MILHNVYYYKSRRFGQKPLKFFLPRAAARFYRFLTRARYNSLKKSEGEIFMSIKTPAEISQAALAAGIAKSRLALGTMLLMGFLAGAYIGMGGYFMLVVTQDAAQVAGVGISKLLGGVVFSLGLFLVLTAGAELVTGNCLMPIAYLSKKISFSAMLRNLCAVYCANFAGALFFAALIYSSGLISEQCGAAALSLAAMKSSLPVSYMLIRGVLCNWFVCLAVWIAFGAQDTAGKFIAALLPISAFVAMGFEHCVANMFFIPLGLMLNGGAFPALTAAAFAKNLFFVTIGNAAGGAIFVALFYFLIFRKELTKA